MIDAIQAWLVDHSRLPCFAKPAVLLGRSQQRRYNEN
jgi:hypothetical protein